MWARISRRFPLPHLPLGFRKGASFPHSLFKILTGNSNVKATELRRRNVLLWERTGSGLLGSLFGAVCIGNGGSCPVICPSLVVAEPWGGVSPILASLSGRFRGVSEMGNVSSVRGSSGEEQGGNSCYEQEGGVDAREWMGEQSPPPSPRGSAGPPRTPLLFTPQAPMAPLQRLDEVDFLNHGSSHISTEYETAVSDQCIPTMITWSHGGEEVAVQGSWDNWQTKQPLQRSGKDFNIMKVLPSGVYQYRFVVDGDWRYSPDLPWTHDEMGNAYNILDLQDFVPDDIENVAGFEPPQSPESSYNNWPIGSEDFSKEPPLVPPQLHLTHLNTPTIVGSSSSSLPRPQHVVLNHLYIQKSKHTPVVALGVTHRFLSKYVTVVSW
ncbi:hypothetical protein Taro_040757 [Colocasia esculenta]|uniref:Association with the SNF1 complex (ASC) domain-containing protein n=1 Tax=Colocasia esculenta TaxID=4460 RepID=A0A843WTY9_COLES|nr:hypothetical protein [Colocasia esculenta]